VSATALALAVTAVVGAGQYDDYVVMTTTTTAKMTVAVATR
jgi:hypothetical protein